jgi:hypothetical protein
MIIEDEVLSLGFIKDVRGFRSKKTVRGLGTGDDKHVYIETLEEDMIFIWWRSRSAHEDTLYDGYATSKEELDDILTNKLRIKHLIS